MTVRELMKKLLDYDPNTRVLVFNHEDIVYKDIEYIELTEKIDSEGKTIGEEFVFIVPKPVEYKE